MAKTANCRIVLQCCSLVRSTSLLGFVSYSVTSYSFSMCHAAGSVVFKCVYFNNFKTTFSAPLVSQ